MQVISAKTTTRTEIAIRHLGIQAQTIGHAVRATQSGSCIFLSITRYGDRVLYESVGIPGSA
jgi:hypothetical protein